MKNKTYLLLAMLLTFTVSFGQLQNGDFEQGIPGFDAFPLGNVPHWSQSHGRPSLYNINTNIALMQSDSGKGDGIIQNYDFEANETYIVTYRINTLDSGFQAIRNNTDIKIFAANGVVPNVGTYTVPNAAGTPQTINDQNSDEFSDYLNNDWKTVSLCFTPNQNYSQLWIYPLMSIPAQQGRKAIMLFDDVTINKIQPLIAIDGVYQDAADKFYIDCRADRVRIGTGNNQYLSGITYSTSHPEMINNGSGSFSFPLFGPRIDSFVITIQGTDPCGNPWRKDVVIERDCCSVEAPTNLSVDYNMYELSWDPVPGAVEYIVKAPPIPQLYCHCSSQLFIPQMTTTSTSLILPQDWRYKCFTWEVIARCLDGSTSPRSGQDCYKYQTIFDSPEKDDIQTASVFPNPNNGDMKISVETVYDTSVKVSVYDFFGRLIQTFEEQLLANKTKTISWNASSKLTKGIYFVKFETENQTINKRVIVD